MALSLTDWESRLPATVNAASARLPEYYEAAKNALERCAEIDEVKNWSDRAAALASYAKQANDKSLHQMAQRIHLRAVARIGELLSRIPPGKGGHDIGGRYSAARDAGLSSRNTTKALAVARIPRQEREEAIEADPPPSVRSLEQMAPRSSETPADKFKPSSAFYRKLSRDQGGLFSFCAWLRRTAPSIEYAGELDYLERSMVLQRIAKARAWLDELNSVLSSGGELPK